MRRFPVPKITLVLLIALACACGASARTTALRVGLVSLNTARDALLTVSKEREAQIVDHATSKEEGKAQLAAWRAHVDTVAATINLAYHAIYGAAILNDTKSASDAAAAVAKALALLKDLKVAQTTSTSTSTSAAPPPAASAKETKP